MSDIDTETADEAAAGAAAVEAIATGHEGSVTEQFQNYFRRVRSGEMGMLPALAGVLVLGVLFSFLSEFFLTNKNIANLLTQTAALMILAIALTFLLIMAEIDLSAGITGGVGMAVFIRLLNDQHWNWVVALLVALLAGVVIGSTIGYFVAKIGVPSFVVTLALFLAFQGLMLVLLGDAGSYRIEEPAVVAIMNKSMPLWAGWVMFAVVCLVSLGTSFYDRRRRQKYQMPVRPLSMLWLQFAAVVIGVGFMVVLLNQNRSTGVFVIQGVPIVVPLALAILWIGQVVLDRTRFGLHIYAVGGNPEGARRAGINVTRVRISAFIICSVLAVVAGLFTVSQVGVVQSSTGRDVVLSGVGAAVIGGVSLFGGRGRLMQATVGAFLISMITNGLGLLGYSAGITFIVTGGVLMLAATIDALTRKRAGSTSLART
jgi:D-xylose transport system permease protein